METIVGRTFSDNLLFLLLLLSSGKLNCILTMDKEVMIIQYLSKK